MVFNNPILDESLKYFFDDKKIKLRNTINEITKVYAEIFKNELEERALSLGIDKDDWNTLCNIEYYHNEWDNYTDFFTKAYEEIRRRFDNNYYDIEDLLNPSTKDLEFQITDTAIKEVYIKTLIEHANPTGYIFHMDTMELYELYKNNKLLSYLTEKYPPSIFDKAIPFEYDKKFLEKQYSIALSVPKYPNRNKSFENLFHLQIVVISKEIYNGLKKNIENKEETLSILKKYNQIMSDFFDYFLEGHGNDENEYPNSLELLLLNILDKYKEYIQIDEELTNFFAKYLLAKMQFYNKRFNGKFKGDYKIGKEILPGITEIYRFNPVGDFNRYEQLFLSDEKIKQLINIFHNQHSIYESLNIYSIIYFDIGNRIDREKYIKEIIYRMKKISSDNNIIVSGLKEYLNSLLSSTFILDYRGEKKPGFFKEISEDLKEVFGEEEYLEFEEIFNKSTRPNKGNEILRKNYKIGLVFGDIKSKKAFELYCNDKRNDKEFEYRQIEKKQFNILAEEYQEQQKLDIENKLKKGLSFVLVFEMDHETKLRNLISLYPNRIIICNVPKQHFSHTQFLKMLDIGLKNYER